MKGTVIAVDQRPDGAGEMAALIVDGRLEDLLIDPPQEIAVRPGQIWNARPDRPMKGQGGLFVDLGSERGFLRDAKGVSTTQPLLVQIATFPEKGKAAPVVRRVVLRSRYVIATPGATGVNVSRAIRDPEECDRLTALCKPLVPEEIGLVIRTAARGIEADILQQDAREMIDLAACVAADSISGPELLVDAADAATAAWIDWPEPDIADAEAGSFERYAVWESLETLKTSHYPLGPVGHMYIEPTRALVAVDVNTGGDSSPAAGLKANIAALEALPRLLRLKGLGGQIVLDLAPFSKRDLRTLEQVAKRAFKADSVETSVIGWTPLGHLELTRKRARLPLSEARL